MEGLIEIKTNEKQEQLVSGRELHKKLNVRTKYNDWINRMIDYGFNENQDYILVTQKRETNNPKNPYTEETDHIIKLDMAKQIAMIQRSEKGKEIREYFIAVEKDWNSPKKIMARALVIANNNIKQLQANVEQLQIENKESKEQIELMKPKVNYVDEILRCKNLMTITQIAKDYGMSGQRLNELLHKAKIQYKQGEQWLLYSKYAGYGLTASESIKILRKNGYEDIKLQTKWTQKGRFFIYKFLTKNGVQPLIERGDIDDMPRL